MALDPDLARLAVCEIVTTGRRSGQPRSIDIWFAANPERDRIYVLSGGRERAHWVRNLRHDPAVRVRIERRWFTGHATEIEGHPDENLARRLLAAKYQGWVEGQVLSGWVRSALPVAIDLHPSPGDMARVARTADRAGTKDRRGG